VAYSPRLAKCKRIAAHEQADMLVVELAALLHDIADSKFHNGDEEIGPATAGKFLNELNTMKILLRMFSRSSGISLLNPDLIKRPSTPKNWTSYRMPTAWMP